MAPCTSGSMAEHSAGDRPPPAGWQRPDDGQLGDLQQRLVETGRELLLAVRALIDWQLERIEAASRPVESDGDRKRDPGPRDIPIL